MSVISNWAASFAIGGLATSASNTIGNGLTQFSISVWVKVPSPPNQDFIIQKYDGSTGYQLQISTNDIVFAMFMAGGSTPIVISSGASIGNGSWHNVVAVFDGTGTQADLKLYIDGVANGHTHDGAPSSVNFDNASNILLGNSFHPLKIDDVRLYSTALTAGNATTLAAGNEISTANRISYWAIEEGSGTTFADTSGNSNDFTVSNPGSVWTTDRPVPPLIGGTTLQLSESLASADQLAKTVFRGLADTASPPTDSIAKKPGKALMEPTLSVVDVEGKITARRLSEEVVTGDWNEQEKNPAQNVWTDF